MDKKDKNPKPAFANQGPIRFDAQNPNFGYRRRTFRPSTIQGAPQISRQLRPRLPIFRPSNSATSVPTHTGQGHYSRTLKYLSAKSHFENPTETCKGGKNFMEYSDKKNIAKNSSQQAFSKAADFTADSAQSSVESITSSEAVSSTILTTYAEVVSSAISTTYGAISKLAKTISL